MTATPYRAISWNPSSILDEGMMDAMANNTQWLYENTPRAVYTNEAGLRREQNIRLASGRAIITARAAGSASVTISFSNLFSSGCNPIVTTSLTATGQRRIFHVINGIGSTLQPDNRGFVCYVDVAPVYASQDKIATPIFVNWLAMGY